ncbi:MAG: hypothetical protein DI635_04115 [Pseudoxanthomonas suwonensis]|nr:MAG: hypothetical protein DI635_04115 [Pseudoxanthomonas suwonensis]
MEAAGHLRLIDQWPLSALIPTTLLKLWPAQKQVSRMKGGAWPFQWIYGASLSPKSAAPGGIGRRGHAPYTPKVRTILAAEISSRSIAAV